MQCDVLFSGESEGLYSKAGSNSTGPEASSRAAKSSSRDFGFDVNVLFDGRESSDGGAFLLLSFVISRC